MTVKIYRLKVSICPRKNQLLSKYTKLKCLFTFKKGQKYGKSVIGHNCQNLRLKGPKFSKNIKLVPTYVYKKKGQNKSRN